jgi:hypothetical protein
MYTDYIGSEPRCSAIAKKMIWWVAAICCTGGTMDATDAIVRARAMTAPSKTLIVQRAERKPILASELVTEQLDVSVAAPPMRDAVMAPAMPAVSFPVVAALPVVEPGPVVAVAPILPEPVVAEAPVAVVPPVVAAAPVVVAKPVVVAAPAPVATAPVVVAVPVSQRLSLLSPLPRFLPRRWRRTLRIAWRASIRAPKPLWLHWR